MYAAAGQGFLVVAQRVGTGMIFTFRDLISLACDEFCRKTASEPASTSTNGSGARFVPRNLFPSDSASVLCGLPCAPPAHYVIEYEAPSFDDDNGDASATPSFTLVSAAPSPPSPVVI